VVPQDRKKEGKKPEPQHVPMGPKAGGKKPEVEKAVEKGPAMKPE